MTVRHSEKRMAIPEGAAAVFMRYGFDGGTTKHVAAEGG